MTNEQDIVERLLYADPFINDPISLKPRLRNPDGPEAAREIERLREELAGRDAEIAAWLRDYNPLMADAIEAGEYRKDGE